MMDFCHFDEHLATKSKLVARMVAGLVARQIPQPRALLLYGNKLSVFSIYYIERKNKIFFMSLYN